jgi:hypothetical protein
MAGIPNDRPPSTGMKLHVVVASGTGWAPEIDLTGTGSPELKLGAVVGNRCSVGNLPFTSLQQKKNGRLVYP